MAKKILTNQELETEFKCRLIHEAYGSGTNISRPYLNKCPSVQDFFTSGLPNYCTYCGNPEPVPGSQIINWYRETTWTCSECGTVMTLTSNQDRGLTFINGSTGLTRLVGENTIVPVGGLSFSGYSSTAITQYLPQYRDSEYRHVAYVLYEGSASNITVTKSGVGSLTATTTYDGMSGNAKVFIIRVKYAPYILNSGGRPVGESDKLYLTISAADVTHNLRVTLIKTGNPYCETSVNSGYCKQTLWIDGWDNTSLFEFYKSYPNFSEAQVYNGLAAVGGDYFPKIFIPDSSTVPSISVPILIFNNGNTPPSWYDCGTSTGCGVVQYGFWNYNPNWQNVGYITPPFSQSNCCSGDTIQGWSTASGCSSWLQSFFNPSTPGGGYHGSDPNPHMGGWININTSLLNYVNTWVNNGVAMLLIFTGENLAYPNCQFGNQLIQVVRQNGYYVTN